MARQTLMVLDDFYEDPEQIRELALSLEFKRQADRHGYPGAEAVASEEDWSDVWTVMREFIVDPVDGPCPKPQPFSQGKFRLALACDSGLRSDTVHVDVQPWSGVVYLSRPEDCRARGAIGFYRCKKTGLNAPTAQWYEEIFGDALRADPQERRAQVKAYFFDRDNWIETERVEMAYNRAVLAFAHRFHGTLDVFGESVVDGRLTQHFEFYASDDD